MNLKKSFLTINLALITIVASVPSGFSKEEFAPLQDQRLKPLKDLNGYFPFDPPKNLDEWSVRKKKVVRRILVANGLWPLPARPQVQATVHGKVEREGYTVERVFFESTPGLYVTGSLYRPSKKSTSGKYPAILSPHGHWSNGRFHDHGGSIERELQSGAEKFKVGGRHPLQARAVQLARMGVIVFHYDMLGYADSAPLSYHLGHRFSKQRPNLSKPERWGLYSAQSESRLISSMGIQTWHSIRALDWIASLPEVDKNRLGVTGASGGGTQTFILNAIDDRISAAFPAVMVSTAMQGGCTCENATYLRIGTGNVEFAALSAPRPIAMTAANDWTKEMPTQGFPHLKKHFSLFKVEQNIEGKYFNFGHNYNAVSRKFMFEFFNKHFKLGQPESIEEQDFVPLSVQEMTVWNEKYPKPEYSEDIEVKILKKMSDDSDQQIQALLPKDRASYKAYKHIVGGALETMIGRGLPRENELQYKELNKAQKANLELSVGRLSLVTQKEELPTTMIRPQGFHQKQTIALWISPLGKKGAFIDDGKLHPTVEHLLSQKVPVLTADLLYQGEFVPPGATMTQSKRVKNPREYAGYTLGYNHPLFAQRVHDVLTLIAFARKTVGPQGQVYLYGAKGAAHWASAAGTQAGYAVDQRIFHLDGFRFGKITDIRDVDLFPGAVKYGDIPALIGLNAPHSTILRLDKNSSEKIEDYQSSTAVFKALGASARLQITRS